VSTGNKNGTRKSPEQHTDEKCLPHSEVALLEISDAFAGSFVREWKAGSGHAAWLAAAARACSQLTETSFDTPASCMVTP
jgi:hypothetical protein